MTAKHEKGWTPFVARLVGRVEGVLRRPEELVPLALRAVQRSGNQVLHDATHAFYVVVCLCMICRDENMFDI